MPTLTPSRNLLSPDCPHGEFSNTAPAQTRRNRGERSRRPRVIHHLAAGILALVSAGLSTAGAASLSPEEREIADRLTGDRGQRRSSGEMRLDPILTAVARARAADMAQRRYFSHVDPDGFGPNYRIQSAGYSTPSFWKNGRSDNFIESIGAGYATAAAAWEGWMNSSGHRTHLLATKSFYRDQTSFGIGCYFDPESPYKRYWVVITAPPSESPVAVAGVRREFGTPRVAVKVPVASMWSGVKAGAPAGRGNLSPGAPRPTVERPEKSHGKPADADGARGWSWTWGSQSRKRSG